MRLNRLGALEGHGDRVWSLCWSPVVGIQGDTGDESTLATSSADKTIKLWKLGIAEGDASANFSGRLMATLEDSHSGTVRASCFSPDGKLLASASFDKTVVIWSIVDGEPVTILEGHESEVKGVAWNPNGSLLATCGRDKTVWFWESTNSCSDDQIVDFDVIDVKHGHSQDVKKIAWHPQGHTLASVSYDNSIKLWKESEDEEEWACVKTVTDAHESTIWDVSFDSSGRYLATCSDDRTIKLWQLEDSMDDAGYTGETTCRCLKTITGLHDRTIYSVDILENGDAQAPNTEETYPLLIASGGGDNAIAVVSYDPSRPEEDQVRVETVVRNAHSQDVNCVRWRHGRRDGRRDGRVAVLASCSDDEQVCIWSLTDET